MSEKREPKSKIKDDSEIVKAPSRVEDSDADVGAKNLSGSRSGGKVFVCCKLPNGLLLRLFDLIDATEATPTGYRTIKMPRQRGESVRINGSAIPHGYTANYAIHAGYGLTKVDSAFWEEWCSQNKDSPLLSSKILFSHDTEESAASQAREQWQEKVKSGLEAINPKSPPAVGLGMKITTHAKIEEAA